MSDVFPIKNFFRLALVVLTLFIFIMPLTTQASMELDLQSPFPGSGSTITINENSLGNYIKALYNYGVSLVAVLAVVMIMYGGFKWIFAAGNVNTIQGAKSTIISAIIGLVLALSSYLLLQAINPDLVSFPPLEVKTPKIEITGCPGIVTTCESINSLTIPNDEGIEDGYVEKYGEDVKAFQRDVCTAPFYSEKCNLPENLCVWHSVPGEEIKCMAVTDIECNYSGIKEGGTCDFSAGYGENKNLYCQSDTDYCSLGVFGSKCDKPQECVSSFCNQGICTAGVAANSDQELAELAQQLYSSGVTFSQYADCQGGSDADNIVGDVGAGYYPLVCSDGCKGKNTGCSPGGVDGNISLDKRLIRALLDLKDKAESTSLADLNNFVPESFTITSLTGGDHSANSIHYTGRAADIIPNTPSSFSRDDKITLWNWYVDILKDTIGVKTVSCDLSGSFKPCYEMFYLNNGNRKQGAHIHLNY